MPFVLQVTVNSLHKAVVKPIATDWGQTHTLGCCGTFLNGGTECLVCFRKRLLQQLGSEDGGVWSNADMPEISDGMPLYSGMYSSLFPGTERKVYPSISAPQVVSKHC